MSDHVGADSLSTTRHVVLILRLVLAPGKRQLEGDVVDPETGWSRRFVGIAGLGRVVERWVAMARRTGDADDPADPAR